MLRERLPEILLEAGSVVFALLLALGANEWRDAHQARQAGEAARRSILAEVRANRQEIEGALASNRAALARLAGVSARGDTLRNVSMDLAQLSSAAWRTAQATQAAASIPFEKLLPISRVYELQDMYTRAQLGLLDRLTDDAPGGPPRRLVGQLKVVRDLAVGLDSSYAQLLRQEGTSGF